MSRPAPRQLSLTEELERIEQQITLTLQEIDSNFSKAHRIVTSGILPVVDQYAKHSSDVWESSKYWKQFFESAANVSLTGYEEAALEDESVNQTDRSETDLTRQDEAAGGHDQSEHDFTLNSPTHTPGSQSTPKVKQTTQSPIAQQSPAFRSPSPRKYTGSNPLAREPATPDTQSVFSSPFQQESASKPGERAQKNDPLLHRQVLDKNYRVLPTPFKTRVAQKPTQAATTSASATPQTRKPWEDSPESSPEISAPQLRSELFSPAKIKTGPRTPGISVQQPTRDVPVTSTGRKLFSHEDKAMHTKEQKPMYSFSKLDDSTYDDDGDDSFAMSPPKTLQFHVPQSRLMQTPAREASKKIVEDLLATAGMDGDTTSELEELEYEDQPSPSVVRGRHDDTF